MKRYYLRYLIIVLSISLMLTVISGCESKNKADESHALASQPSVENSKTSAEEIVFSGTVEGREWIGPIIYNIKGILPGDITIENEYLHRYDNGGFFGPGMIEIWGEANNNAHELKDSSEYSNGMMNLRILVRYEDTSCNIKVLIDSNESVDAQGNEMLSYSPGTYNFNYTGVIPDDIKQIKGRTTLMIEIANMATWGSGENRMTANIKYIEASD